jgi:hypothetical protein
MVNKINENIMERNSTISTLEDMYLEFIEFLNDINKSIYDLSGIVDLIGTNIVQIISILYHYIILPEQFVCDHDYITQFFLIDLSMKIANVIVFYKIEHMPENKVFKLYF